jgi:hypothetical protein
MLRCVAGLAAAGLPEELLLHLRKHVATHRIDLTVPVASTRSVDQTGCVAQPLGAVYEEQPQEVLP